MPKGNAVCKKKHIDGKESPVWCFVGGGRGNQTKRKLFGQREKGGRKATAFVGRKEKNCRKKNYMENRAHDLILERKDG